MEGLGVLQDIAAEKRQIFSHFKSDNIGIINGDQPVLTNVAYMHPVIRFGMRMTNQIQARKVVVADEETRFSLRMYNERYDMVLPNNHCGYLVNVLAAAAVAHVLAIPHAAIVRALQKSHPVSGRYLRRPLKDGRGLLVDDCYNASPESMKAALIAFEHLKSPGKKIAVLGDMLELGSGSSFWHRQIGRALRKAPSLSHVIFVGDQMEWARKTAPVSLAVHRVSNWEAATELLQQLLVSEKSAVLVKGSRGMKLDNLVRALADVSAS
jgi:UDP-N-acetylmuramoyl-tripeptide--D-alanyl-D-alanine ligase